MKNKFLWPVSFILSILIIGTLFIERDNTNLIVNQSNLKSESIFINQLPETQDFKSPKINVWRFNSLYIINGKKYNVSMHTEYFSIEKNVFWKIDLSHMNPCGFSDGVEFFSNDGKSDNDVIVAKTDKTYILLTSNDVLTPYKYTSDDFSIIHQTDDNVDNYLKKLWEAHLSKKNNICYLAHDGKLEEVLLVLNEHPELQYMISYTTHNGEYFSRLPYDGDKVR